MSECTTGATARPTDHDFREGRLFRQRRALGHRLEEFLCLLPDAITFDFSVLRHLGGYRNLESEGLVHARVVRPGSCITILAATSRVLKREDLRRRLFAVRRLAEQENRRVLIATPAGLANESRRLRARTAGGLALVPKRRDPVGEE